MKKRSKKRLLSKLKERGVDRRFSIIAAIVIGVVAIGGLIGLASFSYSEPTTFVVHDLS
jgi:hypothetical protein